MTSKTNTTKKTATKKVDTVTVEAEATALAIHDQTDMDFRNALLIVSVAVNVIVLISWLALKVTSQFDYQVASFLFYR